MAEKDSGLMVAALVAVVAVVGIVMIVNGGATGMQVSDNKAGRIIYTQMEGHDRPIGHIFGSDDSVDPGLHRFGDADIGEDKNSLYYQADPGVGFGSDHALCDAGGTWAYMEGYDKAVWVDVDC